MRFAVSVVLIQPWFGFTHPSCSLCSDSLTQVAAFVTTQLALILVRLSERVHRVNECTQERVELARVAEMSRTDTFPVHSAVDDQLPVHSVVNDRLRIHASNAQATNHGS